MPVVKKGSINLVIVIFLFTYCNYLEPEVVIVNRIAPEILLIDPSFNGAIWNTVLRYNQATSPQRCMPGEDNVHFKKFDAYTYCRRVTKYRLIDSLCLCDSLWISKDTNIIDATPLFFNYKTKDTYEALRTKFLVIEITEENIEQDFSVPGPYGH
ncbi:MAG: hypothetical protein N2053_05305 [Chitinispirillaceae bacterium]|nr:hypothetical protein [Chitinispirillaceae bacterium]